MPQISNDSAPFAEQPETVQRWGPAPGWSDRLIEQGFGTVEWVESTGSTNADLLSIPHQGQVRPAALRWAGFQQAGRGRRGRRWVGRPGDSLTFSIAIERLIGDTTSQPVPPVSPAAFSLVAGLMVADAIEASALTTHRPTLKWPNDVLINGSKVAGILVEVSQLRPVQRMVIGCGLNLRSPDGGQLVAASEPALSATGLLDCEHDRDSDGLSKTCSPAQAAALVTDIALRIRQAHEVFFDQGVTPFSGDWISRHAFHQCSIRLSDAGQVLAEGVCTGIAADGAIVVELAGGPRAFAVGELSARAPSVMSSGGVAQ